MGLGDFIFGKDKEKYDVNSPEAQQATRTNGSYGATRNLQGLANAKAPTTTSAAAAGGDTTNFNQVRGQQQDLYSQLGEQAAGRGPSAAAMAGQQARDASLSQANAILSGRRGGNAAGGVLGASLAAGRGVQAANAQQAQGQANEMATARGQQIGLSGQLAGNDLSAAQMGQQNNQFNAGQANQIGIANMNAYQQNQAQQLQANQQLQNQAQAEMQARLTEQGLYANSLDPGSAGFLNNALTGVSQGAGQAAGAAAVASDRRMKEGVRRESLGSILHGRGRGC